MSRAQTAPALLAAAIAALALGLAVVLDQGDGAFATYDDPFDRFPDAPARTEQSPVERASDRDTDLPTFLRFVVADIQGFWERRFQEAGRGYDPAQVVLFSRAVASGCGLASSETGPFYCPLDQTVYLDVGFFRQLAVVFRAPGDFAEAYVVAHEIGHHVQTLTGITQQVMQESQENPDERNELSIRQELQADCLAGVWGHSTYERGLLERGDLDEALRAAAAVGDDRIQKSTTGRVNRESWTHGSSEQRRSWFLRGFRSGEPADCDSFSSTAV